MSLRPKKAVSTEADVVRANFAQLREAWIAGETKPVEEPVAAAPVENAAEGATLEGAPRFAELTQTEQSAASLGVEPAGLKPISWLNERHYESLLKANAIDANLARRIEVRKTLAARAEAAFVLNVRASRGNTGVQTGGGAGQEVGAAAERVGGACGSTEVVGQ